MNAIFKNTRLAMALAKLVEDEEMADLYLRHAEEMRDELISGGFDDAEKTLERIMWLHDLVVFFREVKAVIVSEEK